jgi:hypothetical protein
MPVAAQATAGASDAPWLSILVPAFNAEAYVRECLESAIAQAGEGGVEIVVVDDCSTDGTAAAIDEIQAAYPGLVRFERLPHNGGVYRARIRLLEMARGGHVWLVDADDRIKMGAVASLKGILSLHSPDFVVCDFSVIGVRRTSWRRRPSKRRVVAFKGVSRRLVRDRSALMEGMLAAQMMQVWTKIFRRSLLDRPTVLPMGRHFEDIAFSLIVALKASSFYYEPSPWIDYRRTPNSIVGTMTPAKHVEMVHALAMAGRALQPHRAVLSSQARWAFRYFCAKHFIRSLRGLLLRRPDDERAAQLQKCLDYYEQAIRDDGLVTAIEFARRRRLVVWLKLVVWKSRARRAMRRDAVSPPSMPRQDEAG